MTKKKRFKKIVEYKWSAEIYSDKDIIKVMFKVLYAFFIATTLSWAVFMDSNIWLPVGFIAYSFVIIVFTICIVFSARKVHYEEIKNG